jgi:hypothetical protein
MCQQLGSPCRCDVIITPNVLITIALLALLDLDPPGPVVGCTAAAAAAAVPAVCQRVLQS